MGSSSKRSKERPKKKRKRDRSKSKERDRHHRRHHKRKKRRRVREERSRSLSLSDISDSEVEFPDRSDDEEIEESSDHQPTAQHASVSSRREYSNFQDQDYGDLSMQQEPRGRQNQEHNDLLKHEYREFMKQRNREQQRENQEVYREYVEPPKSSNSNEISLSIEETNKLRAKMGLKPLKVDNDISKQDGESKEKEYKAGQEVHRPPENLRDKLEVEKLRSKIAAQREKRKLTSKMKKIKTLGESGDEEQNVSEWVLKSRKAEKDKREAEQRDKMLAELDAQFGVGDIVEEEIRHEKKKMYDTRNLSGMRVVHDTERFHEGSSTIMTLKDSYILDNEEDALMNVNLEDVERAEKNIKNRLKKKDEDDPFGDSEKGILGKYDEEIGGEKKKSFRIGTGGEGTVLEKTPAQVQAEKMAKLRKMTTLQGPEFQLANEYMTEAESAAKFKKVKKKKKKKMLKADDLVPLEDSYKHLGRRGMRQTEPEEGELEESGALGGAVRSLKQLIEDDEDTAPKSQPMEVEEAKGSESEQDDLELQEAVNRSRRAKAESRRTIGLNSAESITHMNGFVTSSASIDADELLRHRRSSEENPNMTLNLTDEFCRTLGEIPTYGMSGNRAEEEAALMQEDLIDDKPTWEKQAGAWEEVGIDNSKVEIGDNPNVAILEEEPDTGKGVVNALKLAIKKGYLDKGKAKKTSNAALQHLRAINYSIEDKVTEDDRRGGGRDHHRYTGPTMDFREKDSYKPDVKLDYVDDEGRKLSEKEAFRYLSHKFHGKGSSKNKLEKRMKKWKEELLMKHMSSSDTPLQTLERQREKQKNMGTPYLVLTGAKQEVLDVKK